MSAARSTVQVTGDKTSILGSIFKEIKRREKKTQKKKTFVSFLGMNLALLCYGRFIAAAAFVSDSADCGEPVANFCTVVTRVIRNPNLISLPSRE